MKYVGARLREERKTLNLTQHDFAALGGVESNAQAHYESGNRQPRASYLIGIAGGGADILYVLLGVRTPLEESSLSLCEAKVIKHYRSLAQQDKRAISQLSESLSDCSQS
jgi:transcriptional regulator with XRE-family HTH domain